MTEIQAEYDAPWKEAISNYFQPFLAFFFPDIHARIDWQQPYRSLDRELQELVSESETGDRLPDKLFEVKLLDGQSAWILIHVEVQSQYDRDFAERIYVYNYRAFDRYRQPVVSVAILGDDRPNWRPSTYDYRLDGYRLSLEFPIAKLLDYNWQDLEASQNPFAIMVMAHLKTQTTTRNLPERQQWKWTLVRALLSKGYSKDEVVDLFRFVDRMMALPNALQRQFQTELIRDREERQMPFISRFEEIVQEDTTLKTLRENIFEILQVRFNEVPDEMEEMLEDIGEIPTLRELFRRAISIGSIAEFQQLLRDPDRLSS